MKAFIAKNKHYKGHSSERDYLIIASTKKAALEAFVYRVSDWGYNYLQKDVKEVDILEIEYRSLTIVPGNLEKFKMPISDCFDIDVLVRVDYGAFVIKNRIISEDEKTTKELIKLFKNEYPSFFKDHF